MNEAFQKMNNLHIQVRRNQLKSILQTHRHNLIIQPQISSQTNNDNQSILNASLKKNGLLWQLRKNHLLERLKQKIASKNNQTNEFFVMVICSNIMLDDLDLVEKENISTFCLSFSVNLIQQEVQIQYKRALIYFFQSLVQSFWQYGDDLQQQIQRQMFAYFRKILKQQNKNQQKSEELCYQIQKCLLIYVQSEDKLDSLSRIQRNTQFFRFLLQQVSSNYLFENIWIKITNLPTDCLSLAKNRKLIQVLFNRLRMQQSNKKVLFLLSNFLLESQNKVLQNIDEFKLLIQCSTSFPVSLEKIQLISSIVERPQFYELQSICQPLIYHLLEILKLSCQIPITCECLDTLCKILSYQPGSKAWVYFQNVGGIRILQDIEQENKNQEIKEHLEMVWNLCIDVEI